MTDTCGAGCNPALLRSRPGVHQIIGVDRADPGAEVPASAGCVSRSKRVRSERKSAVTRRRPAPGDGRDCGAVAILGAAAVNIIIADRHVVEDAAGAIAARGV